MALTALYTNTIFIYKARLPYIKYTKVDMLYVIITLQYVMNGASKPRTRGLIHSPRISISNS